MRPQGILEDVALLQEITEACRSAVGEFVKDRTDSEGRVSKNSLNVLARNFGLSPDPWATALKV